MSLKIDLGSFVFRCRHQDQPATEIGARSPEMIHRESLESANNQSTHHQLQSANLFWHSPIKWCGPVPGANSPHINAATNVFIWINRNRLQFAFRVAPNLHSDEFIRSLSRSCGLQLTSDFIRSVCVCGNSYLNSFFIIFINAPNSIPFERAHTPDRHHMNQTHCKALSLRSTAQLNCWQFDCRK